tara:strand:- start:193 stop:951 length:759 start_codon:yes stop_codon:yes gene_type:complete
VNKDLKNKKTTIDPVEHEKFSKLAEEWWDPKGKFKTLHRFNPTRITFIREKIINHFNIATDERKPFKNIKLIDIGCGGGLLSEPMAKLGANVTGLDIVEKNIKTASAHAINQGLKINYVHSTIENFCEKDEKFDVILNMEVIEHVSDVSLFINSCNKILSPNGIMIFASLNRTLISYGLAIIGVEYILGWLPKGTHDWSKFITPDELKILFSSNGLKVDEIIGMKYNPFLDNWKRSKDLSVNYLGVSSKINS